MSEVYRPHLNRLRGEISKARNAEIAFTFIREFVSALLVILVLDYLVHFDDINLRRILLLCSVLYAGYKVSVKMKHPVHKKLDDIELIRLFEKRYPQIQGRWIASVQLAHLSDSPVLAAIHSESVTVTTTLPNESFVRWGPLRELGRVCGLWVCGAALLILAFAPLQLALERLITDTAWPLVNGLNLNAVPKIVPRGEPFRLVAIPGEGMKSASETYVSILEDGNQVQELSMFKNMQGELFVQVDGVERDVELVFEGGDFTSEPQPIQTVDRPRVESLVAVGHYPKYIGLAPKTFSTGSSGYSFIRGGEIEISITANKPLKDATLQADGELVEMSIDGLKATARLPVEFNADWVVTLIGEHGFENKNPLHVMVEALVDQPPQVFYRSPVRDLNLLSTAYVDIIGRVDDDFGVAHIQIVMDRIDIEGNSHPATVTLDTIDSRTQKRRGFKFQLDFAKLHAEPGEVYKFTVHGRDFLGQLGEGRQVAIHIVHPETFNEELDEQVRAIERLLEKMIAREKVIIEITTGLEAGLPKMDMRDMALALEKQNSMTSSAEEIFAILDWIDQQLTFNRLNRDDVQGLLNELANGLNRFLDEDQKEAVSRLETFRNNREGAAETLVAERKCLKTLEDLLNGMGGSQGFMKVIDQIEKIIGVQKDIHNQNDRLKE